MKAVRRKATALLLAAAFLFGAAPAGALAAEAPETPFFDSDLSTDPVTYYQGTYYAIPLSVSASVGDGGKITYQWYGAKDSGDVAGDPDNAISGATSDSYTPPVKDSGTTYYQAVATNTLGGRTETAESAVAEVIVLPKPKVTVEIEAADGTAIPEGGYSYMAGRGRLYRQRRQLHYRRQVDLYLVYDRSEGVSGECPGFSVG